MNDLEREISAIARKATELKESSLRMLIFATDILLARDEMEKINSTPLEKADGNATGTV